MAIIEYLRNHAGQTIEGKHRRKYIVLGHDTGAVEIAESAGKKQSSASKPLSDIKNSSSHSLLPERQRESFTDVTEGSSNKSQYKHGEVIPPANTQEPPVYTELDDETLEKLVQGFGIQKADR